MDYTVNLKFKVDKTEVDKIGKKISEGVDLKSDGKGGSKKDAKQAESSLGKLGSFMTGMLRIVGPILGIAGILVLISALLEPITAILSTMLTVILYPLLKILLAFLKPAAIVLMKFFGKKTEEKVNAGAQTVSNAITGANGGDLLAPMTNYINNMSNAFKEGKIAWGVILAILSPLAAVLEIVIWLLRSVVEAVKAIIWVFQMLWEGGKAIGAWLVEAGAWLYTALSNAFAWVLGIGEKIWTDILEPAWSWFKDIGTTIYDNILKPAFDWFVDIGVKIYDNILKPAFQWFADIGVKIWDGILKPAWDWFKDIGTKIWDIVKSPFVWLADKIKGIWSWFTGGSKSDTSGTHAFGATIPADGKYILHSGETVIPANSARNKSSNNNITINLNVNGSMDKSNIDYIISELKRQIGRSVNI